MVSKLADWTTLCRAFLPLFELFLNQIVILPVRMFSMVRVWNVFRTFEGNLSIFKCQRWWRCCSYVGVNMAGPCQVLYDMNTLVLDAIHSLLLIVRGWYSYLFVLESTISSLVLLIWRRRCCPGTMSQGFDVSPSMMKVYSMDLYGWNMSCSGSRFPGIEEVMKYLVSLWKGCVTNVVSTGR